MEYYDKLVGELAKDLSEHQNLILLIGLAGCGKTSLAMTLIKQAELQKTTRVCLDSIITMESGYNYDIELRNFYREIEFETAKKSLESGYNLVVDDTNITKEIRKLFIDIAKQYRAIQTVGIYFNIPLHCCIERRTNDPSLAIREKYSQKTDWGEVIKKQSDIVEEPCLTEGFDVLFELNEKSSIVKISKHKGL
ncbi:hypothetical protein CH333_04395 [candidate division WOR-3 bacterium JGI_Cruoil_03_44_89]|uniref:UDP-N-acetylglucosamine kinase n=1 Tax=candidate division WOR-3 bacterium JGI_Cruoil_03_44_89 TaxID=1973748 RepID=A0A235BUX8_UNCW3|nr:MAG: hypothetical protein CH333_04395 [candidate division WOR-3 bacterium JGI_Cruoil_03_44_89]